MILYVNKIFEKYFKWRLTRYYHFLKTFQYLINYKNCFSKNNSTLDFRNGLILNFESNDATKHIFSEIFINECYPVNKDPINEKIIIDVGANIGLFTFYSKIKCPNAKIFSIEPDPKNFKLLLENRRHNNLLQDVIPLDYAITSDSNNNSFYLSDNPGWSSLYNTRGAKGGKMVRVKSLTLSSLLHHYKISFIDLLKIDVEGAEYDIILNDNFIEQCKIKEIFVEVDKNPRDNRFKFSDLLDYLKINFDSITINESNTDYPLIHGKNINYNL